MITRQRLISKWSINEWLCAMDPSLSPNIDRVIGQVDGDYLSIEAEGKLKEIINRLIGEDERELLNKLRNSCNGIGWERPADGCPSKILIRLGLARWDGGRGEKLLKATKFAFYEEILYLTGITKTY